MPEMEEVLERYRDFVSSQQPLGSDTDLVTRLERFRQGEDLAWREISASYLKTVLELVESLPVLPRNLLLMDVVQEANVGLVDAIKTFRGTTRDEFWSYAQRVILDWIMSSDERPMVA